MILLVQNIEREGPGLLAEVLAEKGVGYTLTNSFDDKDLPDPRDYEGLILLGGPDSANDASVKMERLLKLAAQALEAKIPTLGICLGLQVLVRAAGGQVVPCKNKELGFRNPRGKEYTIVLTPEGRRAEGFGVDEQIRVFQLHGETVVLGPGMKLLGQGEDCTNQLVRVAPGVYGIQSHIELTSPMLERWLNEDDDLRTLDREKVWADWLEFREFYTKNGRTILGRWLGKRD